MTAHAQLAVGERCQRLLDDAEVLRYGRAGRAAGEKDTRGRGRDLGHGVSQPVARRFRWMRRTETAAGVMPGSREA